MSARGLNVNTPTALEGNVMWRSRCPTDEPPIKRVIMSEFWYFATPYSKYVDGMEAAFEEAARQAGVFTREQYLRS